jgi:hypothetical protein
MAQQARNAGQQPGRDLAVGADVGIKRLVEQVEHLRLRPQGLERLVDRRQCERRRMNQENALGHD